MMIATEMKNALKKRPSYCGQNFDQNFLMLFFKYLQPSVTDQSILSNVCGYA